HAHPRYDSLQPRYSLAARQEFERELEPVCLEQGIGVIPYSPLAAGFLTGKYRRGRPLPESGRAEAVKRMYLNDWGFNLIDRVDEVARAHSSSPAQVSLAWLLARPSITSPITSANTVEQWEDLSKATDLELSVEDIQRLNQASEPTASA
ncbi:MAG: aldo/keto reductase, partial [Chloroflexota bacterium]